MSDTLTWDLVARDKSVAATFERLARSMDGFVDHTEKAGKGFGSAFEKGAKTSREATEKAANQISAAFDGATKDIARQLDAIEREAWESGKGMDQAFTSSLKGMRDELEQVRREASKTGASLESDLGKSLRKISDDADKFGDKLDDGIKGLDFGSLGESLSEGLSGGFDPGGLIESIGGSITGASAGLIGAGAAVASFLWDGLQSAWEEGRVGGLIVAQTGAAAGAAGRLGNLAGDIFYDAFGESIAQVGEAMTAVFQNQLIDTGAPEEAIARITKKVLTLAQTTGESSQDIARSARQLFVTGMAGSLSEGLDLIQRATEKGLNTTDELLDTIEEYSTQFRALGLDGAHAFGLIDQAMEGGARNVDVAADALKEFQILAQESTGTAARGFKALGLDATDSAEKIARGGSGARDVLGQVLDRLRAMPDSVARNTIAVDLFGTKAEDLGNALYSMDVDTAVEQFGDFAGAVDAAGNAISAAESPLDKLGRGIKEWANTTVGAMQQVKTTMEGSADAMGLSWSDIFGGSEQAAEGTGKVAEKTNDMANAADNASGSVETYVGTLDTLIAKQHEYATGQIDLTEAQIDANQAITDAHEAMMKFAGEGLTAARDGFNLNTEAGQKMQTSLNDIVESTFSTIEAMRQQNATSEEVRAYLESQRIAFYNLAVGMGISKDAAQKLTDKLFGMPDKVVPVVGLADHASGPLQTIINRMNQIKSNPVLRQDVYLYTHALQGGGGSMRDYSASYGGYGGRAEGGPVQAGTPYIVGEEGMELFVPDKNGTIIPNDVIASSSNRLRPPVGGWSGQGGGSTGKGVTATVTFAGNLDGAMAAAIQKLIRQRQIVVTVP